MANVNFETYNFDIFPHEMPQIKSCNKKCAKIQRLPFKIAHKNFF